MDQIIGLTARSRRLTTGRLSDFVVTAVDEAPAFDTSGGVDSGLKGSSQHPDEGGCDEASALEILAARFQLMVCAIRLSLRHDVLTATARYRQATYGATSVPVMLQSMETA
jgi:hypothetical protein